MLSRISYILCAAIILYAAFVFYPKWNNKGPETSLGWDACSYYWYLPATFIYQDLKDQKFGDSIIDKYGFTPTFEPFVHESGNVVITYTAGLALMHLPAFTVAHVFAKPMGYAADGFSLPYQVAVQLWSLLAALVGLWYFRKLLLRYFSDKATAVSLLLLVFGTNYLNYTGVDVTLTHSWLFTIYTLLMLNAGNFYSNPSNKYAVRIGLLTGLAILIRPSEMIAVLIPLAWGMNSILPAAIGARLGFLWSNYKAVLLAVLCTLLVGSIQIIYWLYATGEPLVYSYADKGFSWKAPHFFDYTLSYRSGWLVYTPLMFFVFAGLLVFLLRGKNKVAVVGFFLLNYYIVAAWDVWWYGGMGGRAMVQSYAVAFLMIAAFVEWLLSTRWIKWPAFAVMLVFAYVNVWFTYHAHARNGLYDPTGMTTAYYWAVVGRFNVPFEARKLKDTEELYKGEPKNLQIIYSYGFEDDTTASNVNPISGTRSIYFHSGRTYSPKLKVEKLPDSETNWLRAKAKIKMLGNEPENWKMLQFIIEFTKDGQLIKQNMVRVNRLVKSGNIEDVYFDTRIPAQPYDNIEILFWNPGSNVPSLVDDIEVYSFQE